MSDLFENEHVFVDVLLPVPIANFYTYRLPRHLIEEAIIGTRVIVPFGKNRILTGIIAKIHERAPERYKAKYISEILDNEAVVTAEQLWLFQWVADYYMCYAGEVMNMALPSGMKVSSESKIQLNPDFTNHENLDGLESEILKIIGENESFSFDDLSKYLDQAQVNKMVKNLVAKHAIILYEEVKEKYTPKRVKKIHLNAKYANSQAIYGLIEQLEKSEKQQQVLMEYLQQIGIDQLSSNNIHGIDKSLLKAASVSAINTLVKKEIFEIFEVVISRFSDVFDTQPNVNLTEAQQSAVSKVMESFMSHEVALLHGITGSGKTEVYIDLIQKALENGTQVLLTLPEIALTTQIVSRLRKVFGEKMGVYHSKFSDNERVEVYMGVLNGHYQFVVGVRSSIFLPFKNLGLIIIDEEHESSYKQFDPAPRYHARDVAIMIAHRQDAKVLLGSATPSMETYFQAKNNKYGLIELFERFGEAKLPEISLIDMKEQRKNETVKLEFSEPLIAAIRANMEKNEQTIIFQNRRGYAPYLCCEQCNFIWQCHQCAVSLTHHYHEHSLNCHYCGHKESMPLVCPACGGSKLKSVGTGTEKIEDNLTELFPTARILRMDLDTTRTKNALQNMISEFSEGDVDILVGTQMVSKGLDFDKVSLVGVFNADKMIYFPDFRSAERAFQMLTQVSGRAGRKDKPGKVLIQTGGPSHPVLKLVVENDYKTFYEQELEERRGYNYPPFSRILGISAKHVDRKLAHKAAGMLAERLRAKLGNERVLGPERGMVERIRNQYIFEVWLKLEKEKLNIPAAKQFVKEQIQELSAEKELKSVRFVVNVDVI